VEEELTLAQSKLLNYQSLNMMENTQEDRSDKDQKESSSQQPAISEGAF